MVTEALAAAPPVAIVLTSAASTVVYARADAPKRAALRKAWYVRATWRRTALRVGLYQTDESSKVGADVPLDGEYRTRAVRPTILIPALRVRTDAYGLVIEVHTIGRIGLTEFQAAADYLADTWKVLRVQVERAGPGQLTVRALLRDPLVEPFANVPEPVSAVDLASWPIGRDAYGQAVSVRCSGVSGVVVAGLAGFGKTSLINARYAQLAPSPAVQFVFIDGKGGPDYDDLAERAWLFCKDDRLAARDILAQVHQLMYARQGAIRELLGVKNMWHLGPSETWPLVLVVIDEAHTFFHEIKGGDKETKELAVLAAETTRLAEELVRKGRNVGIQVLFCTQKATGDAIPTRIRDNCQVAISYAQRTNEASIAVLGSDIAEFPDAHPRRLQDPAYIGVASMVAEGRPGFTLVRTPYIADEDAARITTQTAHLRADPLELIRSQLGGLRLVKTDPAAS